MILPCFECGQNCPGYRRSSVISVFHQKLSTVIWWSSFWAVLNLAEQLGHTFFTIFFKKGIAKGVVSWFASNVANMMSNSCFPSSHRCKHRWHQTTGRENQTKRLMPGNLVFSDFTTTNLPWKMPSAASCWVWPKTSPSSTLERLLEVGDFTEDGFPNGHEGRPKFVWGSVGDAPINLEKSPSKFEGMRYRDDIYLDIIWQMLQKLRKGIRFPYPQPPACFNSFPTECPAEFLSSTGFSH